MRILAHLSDIHFGMVDNAVATAAAGEVVRLQPTVTVISGDLTQRARVSQFRAARAFLDSLPGPKLVVPGNHDVPLWNVCARFLTPLSAYRRLITPDLSPMYCDEEIVVVGINTARSWTWKNGRINEDQVRHACAQLSSCGERGMKIVVSHHPFDLAEHFGEEALVGRAHMAMRQLASAGADVFLAGHHHEAYTGGTAHRYPINGYSALVVQAGTATSVRLRGVPNSYNVLRIDPPRVSVEIRTWNPAAQRFETAEMKEYERQAGAGFIRGPVAAAGPAG